MRSDNLVGYGDVEVHIAHPGEKLGDLLLADHPVGGARRRGMTILYPLGIVRVERQPAIQMLTLEGVLERREIEGGFRFGHGGLLYESRRMAIRHAAVARGQQAIDERKACSEARSGPRSSLLVVGSLPYDALHLLVAQTHIRMVAGHVLTYPVEQPLVVVSLQVPTALAIQRSHTNFSFPRPDKYVSKVSESGI